VKKVFPWRCIAPGSRGGHVLGQQHCSSFAQSTHGPGWRTAHASSIDEKGLIVKSKATSAPPRVGTTGKYADRKGKRFAVRRQLVGTPRKE